MTRKFLLVAAVLSIVSLSESAVYAQSQTNGAGVPLIQRFQITVPQNITITCPDVLVQELHDGSDADHTFISQQWEVKGNSQKGVNVTFRLDGPFTIGGSVLDHQRRDASLLISPGTTLGPATWNSGVATLATDIDNAVMFDNYSAQSTGVGRSIFNLDMTFVNSLAGGGFGTYEAGLYETTVTGEVTENP